MWEDEEEEEEKERKWLSGEWFETCRAQQRVQHLEKGLCPWSRGLLVLVGMALTSG